ncbi:hypothetical protein P5673_023867 [Acropora cervicornis]|uniref:Uncharacterized protein n=1 Tax=Acropora cervicornis TaxID=6130 RepID=A0AAD9Q4M1_ACRCE|nr:hypothetical protein P5673_023867 [Acropora cervicornis]
MTNRMGINKKTKARGPDTTRGSECKHPQCIVIHTDKDGGSMCPLRDVLFYKLSIKNAKHVYSLQPSLTDNRNVIISFKSMLTFGCR